MVDILIFRILLISYFQLIPWCSGQCSIFPVFSTNFYLMIKISSVGMKILKSALWLHHPPWEFSLCWIEITVLVISLISDFPFALKFFVRSTGYNLFPLALDLVDYHSFEYLNAFSNHILATSYKKKLYCWCLCSRSNVKKST